jgi:hypothetical protein
MRALEHLIIFLHLYMLASEHYKLTLKISILRFKWIYTRRDISSTSIFLF